VKTDKPHHPHPHFFTEWSLVLWLGAIVLAVFGFSGWGGAASWIAQVLSVVFAVLFLLAAILFRSTPPSL
jgi:uncharacterized membrane protein YtjA (UPF0391 family)